MNRILRNHAGEASPVDEVVAHGVTMHLEQMSDKAYWIGVYRPDSVEAEDLAIDLVVVKRKLVVTVRDEAWTWDEDRTHLGGPA